MSATHKDYLRVVLQVPSSVDWWRIWDLRYWNSTVHDLFFVLFQIMLMAFGGPGKHVNYNTAHYQAFRLFAVLKSTPALAVTDDIGWETPNDIIVIWFHFGADAVITTEQRLTTKIFKLDLFTGETHKKTTVPYVKGKMVCWCLAQT